VSVNSRQAMVAEASMSRCSISMAAVVALPVAPLEGEHHIDRSRAFVGDYMNPRFTLGLPLALSLVLGAASRVSAAGEAPLTGLASLRWQHRIILVDAQIPDAIERLREAQQAIDERDILWFVSHQGRLQSNYPGPLGDALTAEVQQRYFSRSNAAVFLIGKDGGLKASDQHFDLPRLFEQIDAMPMRQREMQGR
jgi:hypothetical protein